MKLSLDGCEFEVEVEEDAVIVDGQRFQVGVKGNGLTRNVIVNGQSIRVDLSEPTEDGGRTANVDGKLWQVRSSGVGMASPRQAPVADSPAAARLARPSRGGVAAQMTGRVLRVEVKPGDQVEENALLLILEAMKMENEIRAPRAGLVKRVAVGVGDRVNAGDALVEFEEEAS